MAGEDEKKCLKDMADKEYENENMIDGSETLSLLTLPPKLERQNAYETTRPASYSCCCKGKCFEGLKNRDCLKCGQSCANESKICMKCLVKILDIYKS